MSVRFHCISGNLLIAPDPDQASWHGIWFSDNMHKKSETGLVLQHSPKYLDEDLTHQRVLMEKWSWKTIRLGDMEMYIVPEQAIFAVLERGNGAQAEGEVADGNS